jgi:hypothetical protein
MYIAHKCPKCAEADVVFNLDGHQHKCHSCEYSEDSDVFNYFEKQERHIRDLESKIESMLPFKDLSRIGSLIDLAIGAHVTGKFESREHCIQSLMKQAKNVCNKWQVCYIDFNRIEKKIQQYERTQARQNEESKYADNIRNAREFFKNLPSNLKAECK